MVVYVGLADVLRFVVVVGRIVVVVVLVVVRLVVVVVEGRLVVSGVVGGRVGRGSSRWGSFSRTHLGPGPG